MEAPHRDTGTCRILWRRWLIQSDTAAAAEITLIVSAAVSSCRLWGALILSLLQYKLEMDHFLCPVVSELSPKNCNKPLNTFQFADPKIQQVADKGHNMGFATHSLVSHQMNLVFLFTCNFLSKLAPGYHPKLQRESTASTRSFPYVGKETLLLVMAPEMQIKQMEGTALSCGCSWRLAGGSLPPSSYTDPAYDNLWCREVRSAEEPWDQIWDSQEPL